MYSRHEKTMFSPVRLLALTIAVLLHRVRILIKIPAMIRWHLK